MKRHSRLARITLARIQFVAIRAKIHSPNHIRRGNNSFPLYESWFFISEMIIIRIRFGSFATKYIRQCTNGEIISTYHYTEMYFHRAKHAKYILDSAQSRQISTRRPISDEVIIHFSYSESWFFIPQTRPIRIAICSFAAKHIRQCARGEIISRYCYTEMDFHHAEYAAIAPQLAHPREIHTRRPISDEVIINISYTKMDFLFPKRA